MREKLIELLRQKYDHFCDQCGVNKDSHYIDSLADYLIASGVTIPVRCKDCKHYCSFYNECDEPHNHYTEEGFREVYDNDFCSYGERKDK